MFQCQINTILNESGYLTVFTGHSYYYSAATKISTYTRPVAPAPAPFAVSQAAGRNFLPQQYSNQQQFTTQQQFGYSQNRGRGGMGRGGKFNSQNLRQQKQQEKPDRPKSKY